MDTTQLAFACEIEVEGPLATNRAHFFEIHFETEPFVEVDGREVVWAGFCPAEKLAERPLIRSVRKYLEHRETSIGS